MTRAALLAAFALLTGCASPSLPAYVACPESGAVEQPQLRRLENLDFELCPPGQVRTIADEPVRVIVDCDSGRCWTWGADGRRDVDCPPATEMHEE